MDKEFELHRRERFNALLMRKDDLAKSNDYYRRISPTDAVEVDTKLAAAAEAAAKKKAAAPQQRNLLHLPRRPSQLALHHSRDYQR